MKFIESPTERTTAATDAILAALALGGALYLWGLRSYDAWKAGLWSWAFGVLALSAALGAIAHGFEMSKATNRLFWYPLNFGLGLTVALFVGGVIYDSWGLAVARPALPLLIFIGILFFVVTLLRSHNFLIFIIYEAVGMLFALGAYTWLALSGQFSGAALMALGVLIAIIAAAVQTRKNLSLNFIWQFDHNGLYHLIQMAGLLFLLTGLQTALVAG